MVKRDLNMSDIENSNPGLTPTEAGVDQTRRRLTGAGLAGSGVLLTLASRPVLAQGGICLSPSGFQSGNLSRPNQGSTPCTGRTPGYWGQKNSIDQGSWAAASSIPGVCDSQSDNCDLLGWHDTKKVIATKFCDVFACGGALAIYRHVPGLYPATKMSLMQVMHLDGSQDPFQFGAHMVAAYLNARSGKNSLPSVAAVIKIAADIASTGAGIFWTREQVVTYLKTTMPL